MEIYTKKVIELTEDEKNTLRTAALILECLGDEMGDTDLLRAYDDIRWAIENSPFQIENHE